MNQRNKRGKIVSEYARAFGENYRRIPKAVFAAIAFSFASRGGDDFEHGAEAAINEWWVLYENNIVRQKPPIQKTERTAQ